MDEQLNFLKEEKDKAESDMKDQQHKLTEVALLTEIMESNLPVCVCSFSHVFCLT